MSDSPKLESIPIVDLRLLSQSDLYSLSLSLSDPNRFDDVVIPKIDRSVFNESLGSRKQTYSRFRLAPPSSTSAEGGASGPARRKAPHLRPTSAAATDRNEDIFDPEHVENARVIAILKELFVSDVVCPVEDGKLFPVAIEYADDYRELLSKELELRESASQRLTPPNVDRSDPSAGQKRKRGRPRINKEEIILGTEKWEPVDVVVHKSDNLVSKDRGVVNKDGVVVDFVALNVVEHPFTVEIKRRTEGLMSKVELLEFLGGLNGEWGSRRKKRKVVDADEFGSALPIGWKLSLAVKKRNGQAWVHCRRYISPSGLHFLTCKEVSSYLLSLHGIQDTYLNNNAQPNEKANGSDKSAAMTVTVPTMREGDGDKNPVPCTSLPAVDSTSDGHQMQAVTLADSVDPISSDKSPIEDNIEKGSIRSDNSMEVYNGFSGILLLSSDNARVGELKMANRNIVEVNETADMITLTPPCSGHDSDGDKCFHKDAQMKHSTDRIFGDCSNFHDMESESCYSFLDNGAASHVDENFAPAEKPENKNVPDTGLLNSINHVEVCDTVGITESICGTRDHFKEDLKNIPNNECVLDFLGSHDDQRNGFGVGMNPSTNFNFLTFSNNLNPSSKSPSMSVESEFGKDSNASMLPTPQDGKECAEDNVSSLMGKHNGDGRYSSEISEKGSFNADHVTLTRHESLQFGSSLDVPLPNDQQYISKDFDSNAFECQHKESTVLTTSMSGLGSLSGHKSVGGAENNYVLCGEKMKVSGFDRAQNFGSCDLNDSFNSSDGALFFNSSTRAKITTAFNSSAVEHQQSKLDQNGPSLYFDNLLSEAYTDNNSTPGDQKQVKPFDIDLSGSLFPNRTHGNGIAFNMDHPGRDWSENRGDKMGSSGQNSMAGFANDSSHSSLNLMSHGPSSTGQVFQDCFGATSNPHHQPSSSRTFDLTSHKTGEAAYDVRTNYDDRTNILGSTPNELVEYRFMGEQVPSSLPEESTTLSCTRNPDQELHPLFWLKNDALKPQSSHNNNDQRVSSSVCIWCRNVFFDGSNPCAIQTGEIGTMCPSCSRNTGQFKLL